MPTSRRSSSSRPTPAPPSSMATSTPGRSGIRSRPRPRSPIEARTLANGEGLVSNHQFYLGERTFADANPQVVDAITQSIGEIDAWAGGNVEAAADELAPAVGIPAPVLKLALSRQAWGVKPITPEVVAEQQKIADTFSGPRPHPEGGERLATPCAATGPESRRSSEAGGSWRIVRSRSIDALAPWLLPVAILAGWELVADTGPDRGKGAAGAELRRHRLLADPAGRLARPRPSPSPPGGHWRASPSAARSASSSASSTGFGSRPSCCSIRRCRCCATCRISRSSRWSSCGSASARRPRSSSSPSACSFPVYLNTYHGIRTIDPALVEMARVYGLGPLALFWRVVLPGALPSVFVGLRYGLGIMWLTLIVAETISASSGIGYMTMNAREFLQTDVVLLGIIIYALLGKLSDIVTKFCERATLSWHPSYAAPPAQTGLRPAMELVNDPYLGDDPAAARAGPHGWRQGQRASRPRRRARSGLPVRLAALRKAFGVRAACSTASICRSAPASSSPSSAAPGGGKSTLLRLIAGLERPSAGSLSIDGRAVGGLQSVARMMFQDARLLPWQSVLGNVGIARGRRLARAIAGGASPMSASPIAPTIGRAFCRAASASASHSPAPWSAGRAFSCSTSRSARSMP